MVTCWPWLTESQSSVCSSMRSLYDPTAVSLPGYWSNKRHDSLTQTCCALPYFCSLAPVLWQNGLPRLMFSFVKSLLDHSPSASHASSLQSNKLYKTPYVFYLLRSHLCPIVLPQASFWTLVSNLYPCPLTLPKLGIPWPGIWKGYGVTRYKRVANRAFEAWQYVLCFQAYKSTS